MKYTTTYNRRQWREQRRQVSCRTGETWEAHVKPRSKEETCRRIEHELSRDPRFKDIEEI